MSKYCYGKMANGGWFVRLASWKLILNEKVEILEEDKHIIEKIGTDRYTYKLCLGYNYSYMCDNFEEIKDEFKRTQDKLNEVIDYLNRKEDK